MYHTKNMLNRQYGTKKQYSVCCRYPQWSLGASGAGSCRIQIPSNLATQSKQLRKLALSGRVWSTLAGVGIGLGFLLFGTKPSSTISFVKSSLHSDGPGPKYCRTNNSAGHMFTNVKPHVFDSHVKSGNSSHGRKSNQKQTALGCGVRKNVVLSGDNCHSRTQPLYSTTIGSQTRHLTFLTAKTVVRMVAQW